MGTTIKLLQEEGTKILHAIVKMIVRTTLFSKHKRYGKVLGLLHFTCKIVMEQKGAEMSKRGHDILLNECLLVSL